jgi:hypothetical protein
MSERVQEHRRLILDQFTRQAAPFAEMPAHSHEESIRLFIDLARIGPEDSVLDSWIGAPPSPEGSPGTRRRRHPAHALFDQPARVEALGGQVTVDDRWPGKPVGGGLTSPHVTNAGLKGLKRLNSFSSSSSFSSLVRVVGDWWGG